MMQASSSMSVRDERTGKLLVSMRFSGLPEALDYLAHAHLACSVCGKHFGARSTVTMMNRGSSWELMLPHHCEQLPATVEQFSANHHTQRLAS